MYSIDQLIRFKLILLLHRMSALILKGIAYSGSCQPTGWIAHHYCRSTSLVYHTACESYSCYRRWRDRRKWYV